MKKVNIPLLIGSIILIVILLVILFPEIFVSKSPYTIQHMRFGHENGKLLIERAPYPPSENFLLGSDDLGRDILSFIVYGTRLTVLLGILVSVGQFIIALPLSLFAGFGHRISKSLIHQFNIIFSAIPALLVCIILLQIDFFSSLDKQGSVLAFVVILSAVGWPKLSSLILERVENINQQPFIMGEVAIGKSRIRIALENVIPHLAPELSVLFFMEIARNLAMIMQLGIFGIFVGNLKIIKSSDWGTLTYYIVSFEPEWASMLSTSSSYIRVAPWAVLFPALAFFISVLGFNLFGEGLRNKLQKSNSPMSLVVRKIVTLDFRYLWRKTTKAKKIRLTLFISLMVLAYITITVKENNAYAFDVNPETNDYHDHVIIGTKEADETVVMISKEMEKLGIEPLGEDYLRPYHIDQAYQLLESSFQLEGEKDSVIYSASRDFTFKSIVTGSYSGQIYDATKVDLSDLEEVKQFEGKFVLLDPSFYSDAWVDYFISSLEDLVSVKGVILIASDEASLEKNILRESSSTPVVIVTKEMAKTLLQEKNAAITFTALTKKLSSSGVNVIGIYKGSDEYMGDEAILIGLNYNYLDEEGKEILGVNLALMKHLCQLEGNKRSLIFMFLDGTLSDDFNGLYPLASDFPYSAQKVKVYIDLTTCRAVNFEAVEFSALQAPPTNQFAWSLGHHFEALLNAKKIDLRYLETRNYNNEYYFTKNQANNVMFWEEGIPTIIIGTANGKASEGVNVESIDKEGKHSIEQIGSIFLEVLGKNNY